jgi:FdhD protein
MMGRIQTRPVWRWTQGASPVREEDRLVGEEPLEIRVRGESVSVTMRTPGDDTELAVGFLFSEGVLRRREDLVGVELVAGSGGNVVDVAPAPDVVLDLGRLSRHVLSSSSCGLCGKASIEAVRRRLPPVASDLCVAAGLLVQLPGRMARSQEAFARTGGLHAACIFDQGGGLVVLREDVGRHNAVDKALGYAFLEGLLPLDRHILLVSGRSSFEIMQKALAGGIPVVAAVSAPSELAVRFAEESRQTLAGFLREGRMNVYAHAERICFEAEEAKTGSAG